MRTALSCLLALCLTPALAPAQDDARAKQVAQETLDRGAALFDTRDAAAMAATYVETADLIFVKLSQSTGRFELESIHGRSAIQNSYANLFRDRSPEHKSRNTVDSARFLSPNLLLIQGRFALDRNQGDTVQFVQIRARENDKWQIVTMQVLPL